MKLTLSKSSEGKKEKLPKMILGGSPVADLMPPSSRNERETRELKRRWILIVFIVFAFTLFATFASVAYQLNTKRIDNTTNKSSEQVVKEMQKYKDVDEALSSQRLLKQQKNAALSTEVDWNKVFKDIQKSLSKDVELTSINATVGGPNAESNQASMGVSALISAPRPISYSDVLVTFASVPGVTDVQIGNLSYSGDEYRYPVAFGLDYKVFNNRVLAGQ